MGRTKLLLLASLIGVDEGAGNRVDVDVPEVVSDDLDDGCDCIEYDELVCACERMSAGAPDEWSLVCPSDMVGWLKARETGPCTPPSIIPLARDGQRPTSLDL